MGDLIRQRLDFEVFGFDERAVALDLIHERLQHRRNLGLGGRIKV